MGCSRSIVKIIGLVSLFQVAGKSFVDEGPKIFRDTPLNKLPSDAQGELSVCIKYDHVGRIRLRDLADAVIERAVVFLKHAPDQSGSGPISFANFSL